MTQETNKEDLKAKLKEKMLDKIEKYIFYPQPKEHLEFLAVMGILVLPIVEELLGDDEELLKMMTLPLHKGNALTGGSSGNGILATTTKKLIVLVPVKKMLGKVSFDDVRLVDYVNVKIIEQKGLKKMNPGTHLLDIKYRNVGNSRLKKPKLTFYYLHTEKAAYLETLISGYKQNKYAGGLVPQATPEPESDDPLEIAKRRLAAGEISIDEFNNIKTALG